MNGSKKIVTGAVCAVVAASAAGFWLYGVYAAGRAFDEAAIGAFETILPPELTARVTHYEGGFFQKSFRVSFVALGDIELGTFNGAAYPGFTTRVKLTRAPDGNFEKRLLSGGVQNFDDRLEFSYASLPTFLKAGPKMHATYAIKPFTVVSGGQCDFDAFTLDIEADEKVTISAHSPGMRCRAPGQPVLEIGKFDLSYSAGPDAFALKSEGVSDTLAESKFKADVGAVRSSLGRFDSLRVSMNVEPDAKGAWTETMRFELESPSSPLWDAFLGNFGSIDRVAGTLRITSITDRLSEQFSQILLGPELLQADLMTLALEKAMMHDGLAIEVNPLEVVAGKAKATLDGRIASETEADAARIVGRFDLQADEDILPEDMRTEATAQGYLTKTNGRYESQIVLAPDFGTANGVPLY